MPRAPRIRPMMIMVVFPATRVRGSRLHHLHSAGDSIFGFNGRPPPKPAAVALGLTDLPLWVDCRPSHQISAGEVVIVPQPPPSETHLAWSGRYLVLED